MKDSNRRGMRIALEERGQTIKENHVRDYESYPFSVASSSTSNFNFFSFYFHSEKAHNLKEQELEEERSIVLSKELISYTINHHFSFSIFSWKFFSVCSSFLQFPG